MARIVMVCEKCGSPNIVRDAWANWSVETQEWVLGNTFDHCECEDCEGETHVSEIDLDIEYPETAYREAMDLVTEVTMTWREWQDDQFETDQEAGEYASEDK